MIVLRSSAGVFNADEAYAGIESFEILDGNLPVVLGGDAYTLPLESYLMVPFVALFGAAIVPLKLLSTGWWMLAGLLVAEIGMRLWSRRAGVIAAALLWIAPGGMLLLSVTAYVGYSSGLVASLVAFGLAHRLLDSEPRPDSIAGCFGAAAGFGIWLHPMFVSTLLPMVLTVSLVRREPRTWSWIALGGVLGCAPLVVWNALNGFPTLDPQTGLPGTYIARLRTFAIDLVPRTFGLRDFELGWELPVLGPMLYVSLMTLTVFGVVALVQAARCAAALLLPIVLVSAFPIMALFSRLIYANDGRYGVITFPFLLLGAAIGLDVALGHMSHRVVLVGATGCVVWLLGFVGPGVRPLILESGRSPNEDIDAVVARLDEAGIDRIIGSYWGELPVEFVADRTIIGGVTPASTVRFPERQSIVEAAPPEMVAFVFLSRDEAQEWLWLPVDAYRREEIGRFVVYVPESEPAGAG